MNIREDCKGCRSYFEGTPDKCSVIVPIKFPCPCSTCLVKGVCKQACDEFEFVHGLVPSKGYQLNDI